MAERPLSDTKIDEKIDRLLELVPAPELSPDLRRKLSGALGASLRGVKPLPAARILTVQFVLVFVVFAAALIATMGVAGFRMLQAWQALGIVAILVVGVSLLSLVLAWQVRPGSLQKISATLSWTSYGIGFLTGVALLFPWRESQAFASQGWPCLLIGSAVALPGGILFWLLTRRGVPLLAVTFGGTVGAISGLLGVTVLQFRCIHQDAAHVIVWHGGVLLLSIVAGILIARVLERTVRSTQQ
jgi:hypothetical protein